jgi:hypothetical protein
MDKGQESSDSENMCLLIIPVFRALLGRDSTAVLLTRRIMYWLQHWTAHIMNDERQGCEDYVNWLATHSKRALRGCCCLGTL